MFLSVSALQSGRPARTRLSADAAEPARQHGEGDGEEGHRRESDVKIEDMVGCLILQSLTRPATTMKDSPHTLKARLTWVKLYQETGNAPLTCRRCGISRPTLRKWWRRYQADGEDGLRSRSRRPHNIQYKLTDEHIEWIRHLRLERKLGPKRIQAELIRLHGLKLAASTIWTVLLRNGWRYLKGPEGPEGPKGPAHPKRYAKEVPGDRVQIDTVKVAKGLFQYTATDDCRRLHQHAGAGALPEEEREDVRALAARARLEGVPLSCAADSDRPGWGVLRNGLPVGADGGTDPVPAHPPVLAAPERESRAIPAHGLHVEFYATADLAAADLPAQLKAWQQFYDEVRPHGGIGGRALAAQLHRAADRIPTRASVTVAYDPSQEGNLRIRDHAVDKEIWPPS